MICPVCSSDMIVVEHNRVELDYCTNCRGVWFDSGELELLLESMKLEGVDLFLGNILDSVEARSAEKKLRCPICGRKMKKVTIGQDVEVLIDVCPQGDGLWFDGGEVGELVGQVIERQSRQEGSQQELITFLGETFRCR